MSAYLSKTIGSRRQILIKFGIWTCLHQNTISYFNLLTSTGLRGQSKNRALYILFDGTNT